MNTKVFVRRINKCLELMIVLSVTSRGKVVIGDKSTFIHKLLPYWVDGVDTVN